MKKDTPKKIRGIIYIIMAVLNIAYGIIVRAVHSEHISFMLWIGIGIFFIIAYLFCRFDVLKRLPKVISIIIIAVLIFGLVLFAVAEINVVSHFGDRAPDGLDYVIVLGAGIDGHEPSPSLKYRLDAAYDYLKGNPDTVCILTGGRGDDEEYSEAEVMYDYMAAKGIEDSRMIVEDKALDTIENIRNSKEYIVPEGSSVGIITSNYHVFRALRIAEKQGLENVYGMAADAPAAFVPHNMVKEAISIAVLLAS